MRLSPVEAKRLLVVAPHPDDELLGCAYLMRAVADRGDSVVIAWMTDGGASHGECDAGMRARLVAVRQHEALAGLAKLGVMPVATYFLGYTDGELGRHERAAGVVLQEIALGHDIDTLCVTSSADNHPDHRASYRIAISVAGPQLFAYRVSGRYDGSDAAQDAEAVTVNGLIALKRGALSCHVSQQEDGGARFPMTAAAIDDFCATEVFVPIGMAQ